MLDILTKSGKDPEMGTNLSRYFVEAGIGKPTGTNASSIISSLTELATMLKTVTLSYKTALHHMNIATEENLDKYIRELEKAITAQENYYCLWPMLHGAWIKKLYVP